MFAARFASHCLLPLIALSAASCGPPSNEFSRAGSTAEIRGFWFQAGGLCVTKDWPGALFGMAKAPGHDRELSYLVIFQHHATARSKVTSEGKIRHKVEAGRHQITVSDGIHVDGTGIDIVLEMALDLTKKTLSSEEMTFAGQKVDLAKGRLFLVDLTGESVSWKQLPVVLPTKPSDPSLQSVNIRNFTQGMVTQMVTDSKEVGEFLR